MSNQAERTPPDDTTKGLRRRVTEAIEAGWAPEDGFAVENAADAAMAVISPMLERLRQRVAVLQDREEEVIDPLRCQVAALQAEVERLKNELGQYRLDEQYDAMATAGAFDEEDPY